MQRSLILTVLTIAIAGCQTVPQTVPQASSYRWNCNDKPFEAGLCDQPTNWRLSDFMVQR
ncbi:hypothetical protein EET67_09985 [Pseudaminobacter arsenicus]|uniref:Uncharacterized protein n=1 Tax=Borborobacter arsenicus TaxID=1851146 RepID=A0A432V704_9HYPH|nr:hypothetical protein [Pseudaminobacter arsenicus]RUM97935.1 hypothetical protein EET67_09985 [Pseudaminobacter arsenicus]